jgi:hypothetical protein
MKRRYVIYALVTALALSSTVFAQGKASGSNQWALLFDAKNLLALDGFEDGYQAGVGVMYWATPNIAARALVRLDYNNPEGDVAPTRTEFGLGLAGLWHPTGRSAASPYVGALAGFQTLAYTGADTLIDFYFGAAGGVEVKLLPTISCFAEYQLLAAIDAQGVTISLGTEGSDGSRALVGLIFYF